MNQPAAEDLLNRSQRMAVATTLRRAEWTLRHALIDLDAREQGILYGRSAEVSGEQRAQMEPEIARGLDEIARLAGRLDLPAQDIDHRAVMMGQLSILWSDLEDTHAEALRRYGEVTPGLAGALDPGIDALIGLVDRLLGLLADEEGER